jgi:hypothetical protein
LPGASRRSGQRRRGQWLCKVPVSVSDRPRAARRPRWLCCPVDGATEVAAR